MNDAAIFGLLVLGVVGFGFVLGFGFAAFLFLRHPNLEDATE